MDGTDETASRCAPVDLAVLHFGPAQAPPPGDLEGWFMVWASRFVDDKEFEMFERVFGEISNCPRRWRDTVLTVDEEPPGLRPFVGASHPIPPEALPGSKPVIVVSCPQPPSS